MNTKLLKSLSLAALLLGTVPALRAATITVDGNDGNGFADVVADDGHCSCREAIENANSDGQLFASPGECSAGTGADTVLLPAGTITLGSGLALTGDLTLSSTGAGTVTLTGPFQVSTTAGSNVTISDITFSGLGNASADAIVANGASFSFLRSRVVSSFHDAFTNQGGLLSILDSEFESNGIPGWGQGIGVNGAAPGSSIKRTLVSQNNDGMAFSGGTVLVENCTLNQSISQGAVNFGAAVTMDHVTISNNSGSGIWNAAGSMTLSNSIVRGNTGNDFNGSTAIISGGHNIWGTGSGFTTLPSDLVADPALQGLAANGGFSKTRAILTSSVAHHFSNAGDNLAEDQRAALRYGGGNNDAGAYELPLEAPTVSALSFNSAAISGTAGLVISGFGFVAPLTVTVKGVDTTFVIDSATQITADVPANTAGAGRVVVTNSVGASADVAADDFSYASGPIVVTTTNDVVANDGVCSAREAVGNANNASTNGRNLPGECGVSAAPNTILMPSGTITLGSSMLVSADMTLSGQGSGSSLIAGPAGFYGLTSAAGTNLSMEDLSLSNLPLNAFGSGLSLSRCALSNSVLVANPLVSVWGSNFNVVDSTLDASNSFRALWAQDFAGTSTIQRSTLSGATIHNVDISGNSGSLVLTNDTIVGPGNGLLLNSSLALSVAIDHCTIVGGPSGGHFGIGVGTAGTTVTVGNSILFGSQTDINNPGGTVNSSGYNVVGTSVGFVPAGSDLSTDPNLGPLTSQGGFTKTMAINVTSVAYNAAAGGSDTLAVDQRGVARPQFGVRDIGAFEQDADQVPPVISAQAPANNSLVGYNSPLWASLSDNFGIAAGSVTLTVDATTSAAYNFSDGVSLTYTGAALADGIHYVSVTASDAAANTSTATWAFTVDSTAPTITAQAPVQGAFTNVSGPSTVFWAQINDANLDLSALTITANGDNNFVYSNGSLSSTAAPIDGLNQVTVTVKDLAGNVSTLYWAWTLDTVPPVSTLGAPADGAFVASGLSPVWAGIDDANGVAPASVSLTVDGIAASHNFNGVSVTRTGGALADGLHQITVSAADQAGNAAADLAWVFTVDTLTPTSSAQYPADNAWTNIAAPAVEVSVADANLDAGALTLTVNTVAQAFLFNGISLTQTGAASGDGLRQVTLTAKDKAGNTLILPWVFRVDTTPPSFSAAAPQGLTNSSNLAVHVAVSDGAGIGVIASGLQATLDLASAPFSFDGKTLTLTAGTFSNGTHYVHLTGVDQLGNAAAPLDFQFTVFDDVQAPSAVNPSPVGLTTNASPLIHAQLIDAGSSGVAPASVSMTVDGAAVAALADASEVSFTASALLPGVHTVTVDLKDNAGNTATQLVWQFTVTSDTIAPTVGNPSPLGVVNSASPFIYVSLTDTGGSGVNPLSVSMTVDGVAVPALANASEVSYTAQGLSDGTHTVTVDVADNAGNQATQFFWSFNVASDTVKPVATLMTPTAASLLHYADPVVAAALTDSASGVDYGSVTLTVDGGIVPHALELAGDGSSVTLSSTALSLASGIHTVTVDFKDKAGNAANQLVWSFNVVLDTTVPIISSPSPAGVTSNAAALITAAFNDGGTGIDTATALMRVDGVPVASSTDGVSISYTASALADGVHTVSVDVKDLAGNAATQLNWQFTVSSDVTAPVVSAVTAPTAAARVTVTAGASIPVSYDYTEANPASVSITVSQGATVIGSTVISSGLAADASRTDNVSLLNGAADGVYDVRVTVFDKNGQMGSLTSNASVLVDSSKPALSAASPTGVTSNANTFISAAVLETGSGLDTSTLKLLVDSQPVVAATDGVSISYTASALADGVHTVSLDVKDLAGNAATQLNWQFTVSSDVTPPDPGIMFPTSAQPVTVRAGANVDVAWGFTEANPKSAVLALQAFGTTLSAKTVDLATGGFVSGQIYGVQLQALSSSGAASYVADLAISIRDVAGNLSYTVQPGAVVVDADAPTASLNVPTGTVVDANGDTTITLQLADTGGSVVDPASVKFYLDGVLQTAPALATAVNGGGLSVSVTASGLAAGLHTVSVDFADLVGNAGATQTWTFTMVRDNTPPVLAVPLSPTAGSPAYTSAGSVLDVQWSYVEANPVDVSITVIGGGGQVIGQSTVSSGLIGSDPYATTVTTAVSLLQGAPEGTYNVTVRMKDVANQLGMNVSTNSVIVDNTAPVASAGLPAGGSIVQTASPAIQASLADLGGSGVDTASVVLTVDGTVVTPSTLTTAVVGYNASGLADGPHTVKVQLKDKSGNAALAYSWSFRTDVSNPDLSITLPAAGAYVRGTVPFEVLSTDAGSGVTYTAFFQGSTLIDMAYFNGVNWKDSAGNASPSASVQWNTTLLTDGIYTIHATATDLVGNTGSSSSRTVTIDNTLPVIVIDPVFSPTQYQSQTITGSVTEQNLAELKVNGILATLNGSAPNWTFSAVVPLNPGANGITVTASDLGGNGASATTGITMDPTAAVHFISPAPNGIFRATVGIELTAPPAANTVTLEVSPDNGATWYSIATPSVLGSVTTLPKNVVNGWRLNWDTINDGLADGNGSYQLRAVAYDQVGVQLGSAVVAGISTDNTAPQFSFITLPAPVLVGPHYEVYQELVTDQGTVTETGAGESRVIIEHYNGNGDHVTDSPGSFGLLADHRFSRDERLVPGFNHIVYTVVDGAGNSVQASTDIWYVLPQNSGTICSVGGGLAAPDGTAIQVPANALVSCVDLSIKTILRSLLASPADSFLKIVGEGHQIEPVSLVFQAQATLTLPYTDADLDPDADGTPNYDPATLTVLFWDGSVWQNVGVDNIDTATKRVTVRTNHLGLFALAADTKPIPTEAKVYLTRNPFRYNTDQPTSFVYELPSSGRVTIKIYDKTGDLVRTLVNDLPQVAGRFTQVWDGLNNFNRFVGSGIYLFRFEAALDNGQKQTVTKAIGVLK